ncbi:hypothetical protein [Clostridium estertheticum]|uniref:hypothetical protein n=1 Tax=Clostridium estertheticum TaxID=238834 RepID=UPI001CF44560|nr:hypothetical protein [Clostridium estertheticum]MCB2358458.1 hypothetical protein [Clostridium estertheticum]
MEYLMLNTDKVVSSEKLIIPDKNLNESLISKVKAVPTTIFVDKSGKLVGDIIEGAVNANGSISVGYLKKINERLQMIGK